MHSCPNSGLGKAKFDLAQVKTLVAKLNVAMKGKAQVKYRKNLIIAKFPHGVGKCKIGTYYRGYHDEVKTISRSSNNLLAEVEKQLAFNYVSEIFTDKQLWVYYRELAYNNGMLSLDLEESYPLLHITEDINAKLPEAIKRIESKIRAKANKSKALGFFIAKYFKEKGFKGKIVNDPILEVRFKGYGSLYVDHTKQQFYWDFNTEIINKAFGEEKLSFCQPLSKLQVVAEFLHLAAKFNPFDLLASLEKPKLTPSAVEEEIKTEKIQII